MQGLGILILIVLFFWIVRPWIARWLKRKAMERAEDYMRSSMGMPPRDKKKKRGSYSNDDGNAFYQRERRNPFDGSHKNKEPLIPKEYAEDVEFVETISYSETIEFQKKPDKSSKPSHESQISDAEFIEIKESGSK